MKQLVRLFTLAALFATVLIPARPSAAGLNGTPCCDSCAATYSGCTTDWDTCYNDYLACIHFCEIRYGERNCPI
jgi:hypothetical protein